MRRKRDSKNSKLINYIYIFVFMIITAWLLISIIQKKNPLNILKGGLSELSENATTKLQQQLIEKDSIINELQNRLAAYEGSRVNSRRALVIIESETLNMRSGPSLSSDIIEKIPANSEVELLYYDSNTFYIDSQAGKWARINYAGTEGWVWGNYLREI